MSSTGKKLLFLDVDGVLHRLRLELRNGKAVDDHCFTCCGQLQRVVQQTGAELVLSSSWRCYEGARLVLADALAQYGLRFTRWTTVQDLPGGRAAQILDFVAAEQGQVGAWAVVDDEELVAEGCESLMMQVLAQRFVRTNPEIGMTQADGDQLINILNSLLSDDEEDEHASDNNSRHSTAL